MSEPADIIQKFIERAGKGYDGGSDALAALARLEAELKRAQQEEAKWRQACVSDSFQRSQAAYDAMEERSRLQAEALSSIANPLSTGDSVGTMRAVARAALAVSEAPRETPGAGLFHALRVWTLQHLNGLPDEVWEADDEGVLNSLLMIVQGETGCTEQGDYTIEQWDVLRAAAAPSETPSEQTWRETRWLTPPVLALGVADCWRCHRPKSEHSNPDLFCPASSSEVSGEQT